MVTTLVIAMVAVLVALLLAFLPLRFLIDYIGRNVVGPVKAFMERQRERRVMPRETPDRRQL